MHPEICGIMSNSGPNGEPLACAYPPEHDGDHSWATLPTFPLVLPEMPTLPAFTTLEALTEPLIRFGSVWLRMSAVDAVVIKDDRTSAYVVYATNDRPINLGHESTTALLAYLEGKQDE